MISFKTSSGVRQGGPESPCLFNLYLDFVMRLFIERCKDVEGINFFKHSFRMNLNSFTREERLYMRNNDIKTWGESSLPWSGYADDIVLFLLSAEGAHKATELLDRIFTSFGLSINVSKTETMSINSDENVESFVTLRGEKLKNVEQFKYLGAVLHYKQPNTGETELNHRIQMANAKFVEMSNLLQNVNINLRLRVFFLNSFVRSRLSYACQNWNLTQQQYDQLDTTYRLFLRRMVRGGFRRVDSDGNDFRYAIDNERLHGLCGTSDLNVFIKQQQYNYSVHVIRMSLDRSTKMLMFNDDRYSKRGRFSKSLLDQVVANKNCSVDELCKMALRSKNGRST